MYPEYIKRSLRQRLYDLDDKNDTSRDESIDALHPLTAFENVVDWKLGNGWGQQILDWLESCNLEVKPKSTGGEK